MLGIISTPLSISEEYCVKDLQHMEITGRAQRGGEAGILVPIAASHLKESLLYSYYIAGFCCLKSALTLMWLCQFHWLPHRERGQLVPFMVLEDAGI